MRVVTEDWIPGRLRVASLRICRWWKGVYLGVLCEMSGSSLGDV